VLIQHDKLARTEDIFEAYYNILFGQGWEKSQKIINAAVVPTEIRARRLFQIGQIWHSYADSPNNARLKWDVTSGRK
jgi:hypothetical protein